jgi:hypothetical protein
MSKKKETKIIQAKPHKPIAGPKVGKIYTMEDVDKSVLTEQLLKDDVSNWIVKKGIEMIEAGKNPGRNMITFLEHIKILK